MLEGDDNVLKISLGWCEVVSSVGGKSQNAGGQVLCQRVSWHLHSLVGDVTSVLRLSGEVEFTTDLVPYMS